MPAHPNRSQRSSSLATRATLTVACGLVVAIAFDRAANERHPSAGDIDTSTSASMRVFPDSVAQLRALNPDAPNPYLSFLPTGAEPDWRYWRAVMARGAAERAADMATPDRTLVVAETEPNDSAATAQLVVGFGTGDGDDPAADVSGSFAAVTPAVPIGPFAEDDGAIPLASDTGLSVGAAVTVDGIIGDGPYGSSGTGSGDHDFFRIPGVEIGQVIVIDIDTAMPLGDLDTFIALYDSEGNAIALNEDEDMSANRDGFLAIPATVAGDHYVSVAGSLFPFAAILADPLDPTTGFGVGSEGDYTLTLSLEYGDPDWYAFDLETCDILGIDLSGTGPAVSLLLEEPGGALRVASSQDLSFAYPAASTLPGGGRATLAHVVAVSGRYRLRVLGANEASYDLALRIFRQPRESEDAPKRLFVDFDGATVDPAIFGATAGMATLSPLSSFLSRWGLDPADEDAVIDATLASLEESLREDPRLLGPNRDFDVTILNSRDHADPFGAPDVSRLIVGGSIPEFGIPTIGIAQSIDPGNFESAETAVILLDLLSGDAIDPNSLNGFPIAPGATKTAFVGRALGNIAAHEAGHYVGNFHTEQFNDVANIMDRGGNLPNTLGLGPDGTFGSADDVDVDFGEDPYEITERFSGIENTLAVLACGCTTSPQIFADGFETGDASRWASVVP